MGASIGSFGASAHGASAVGSTSVMEGLVVFPHVSEVCV